MNNNFKEKAKLYTPPLKATILTDCKYVDFKEDNSCYQNTKIVCGEKKDFYVNGDKICLDFGRHITGNFKFDLGQYDVYLDAPVRLKIKFAETPFEARKDFNEKKSSAAANECTICSSWLQEEIINIDRKGAVSLPRRYAFRYVEIKVIATPQKITLGGFSATAYTSADYSKLKPISASETLKKIDAVSTATLAECMQDVFEDGPKRDRRLWLGDLRLQALADYYTFKNTDLTKRCLYLFAAFEDDEKLLPGCLFTNPDLELAEQYPVTYALMFAVVLCDYFEHTNDKAVVEDLFSVAEKQITITKKMLDKNKILTMPKDYGWWTFVDWADLKPVTATMGTYIYTIKRFSALCASLGKKEKADEYSALAKELEDAALTHLYDGEFFVNSYDENQYSIHSQVWMILAETVTKKEAQRILKQCIGNKKFLAPGAPYMHHYVVEALIWADMTAEAKDYIKDYWGEMVSLGADTFWETFSKDDPYLSPYGNVVMNSACHAWSCTPSYFIRKYGME